MALFLAMLLLFLPLGAYGPSQAAPPEAQKKKAPAAEEPVRRPPEILELIGRAHAVPPEFGADALIRIALSSKVNDPEWKRELLEEAFYLAGSATEPVRRSAVVTLHNGNSRSGYRAQGYDFNLDGLSLQARAIRSLLAVDRKRALKLLGDVRLPELPTLTCKDVFIYQVNDFYEETVTEAANRAFTPEELSRGENFTFLENYVKDLRSPAQIGPLANLLAAVKVTPEQFAQLVQTYSVMLAGVPADPRSSYLPDGIWSLVDACRKRGVSPVPLLSAARSYLVSALSRLCADSAARGRPQRTGWRLSEDPEVPPIDLKEITVEIDEGTPDEPAFWRDPVAKQLLTTINDLRGRADLRADPAQWESRFNDFVGLLQNWTGTSEKSEADYFHQKCLLLQAAVQVAPAGSLHDGLLRSYVMFLASSGIRQTSPIEWLVQANPIIQAAQSPRPEERDKVVAIIRDAQDPVLNLYAELGRLLQ